MSMDGEIVAPEAGEASLNFGTVFEIDERFMGVPSPPERAMSLIFIVFLVTLAVIYYVQTMDGRAWDQARRVEKREDVQAAMAAYKGYLAQFPEGANVNPAKRAIDTLSFKAHRQNGIAGLQTYLKECRVCGQKFRASDIIEELTFLENRKAGTCEKYLEAYPEGRFAKDAQKEVIRVKLEKVVACHSTCIKAKIDTFDEKTKDAVKAKTLPLRPETLAGCCQPCEGMLHERPGVPAADAAPGTPPPPSTYQCIETSVYDDRSYQRLTRLGTPAAYLELFPEGKHAAEIKTILTFHSCGQACMKAKGPTAGEACCSECGGRIHIGRCCNPTEECFAEAVKVEAAAKAAAKAETALAAPAGAPAAAGTPAVAPTAAPAAPK